MGNRFVWSRPPIAGESLLGFVTRNADVHAADKVSPVLRAAGIETIVPESLPTVHRDRAPELAYLFMTTPEEILSRAYQAVAPSGRPNAFVSFFGTPLRKLYLELYRRRVSPGSLRRSGHHRALWDIRPLSFCVESKEVLLSSCPTCSAELGWRWTLGPAFCETCGFDLREFSGTKIEIADEQALDFTVDLIHPDPHRRNAARALADTSFNAIGADSGDLFELVIAIASTLAADSVNTKSRKVPRGVSLESYARLTPTTLSEAGRIVMDWRSAFDGYLHRMRCLIPENDDLSGSKSQFGMALRLQSDRYLAPAIRMEISKSIAARIAREDRKCSPGRRRRITSASSLDNRETTLQVAADFGVNQAVIRRWIKKGFLQSVEATVGAKPVSMVDPRDVEQLVFEWKDAVPAVWVREHLGVDSLGLRELASAGLIRRLDGVAAFSMKGGDAYSQSDTGRFIGEVKAKATACPDAIGYESLRAAIKRVHRGRIPWSQILSAVVDGRLTAFSRKADTQVALVDMLLVAEGENLGPLLVEAPVGGIDACGGRLSIGEAAGCLATTETAVTTFIKDGILATNGSDKWKLDRSVIESFQRRYMLTGEILRRCGIRSASVRTELSRRGIHPVCPEAKKNLVWPRAEVEAAFAERLAAARGAS